MQAARGSAGIGLGEALLALALVAMGLGVLHATRSGANRARESADEMVRVHRRANELLARMREIPFGRPDDPAPSAAQLDALFVGTGDPGPITLHQLARSEAGWSFVGESEGLRGTFCVKVGRDLDRDGATGGFREGRDDLLGIEIRWGGELVLAGARAADPQSTARDAEAGR